MRTLRLLCGRDAPPVTPSVGLANKLYCETSDSVPLGPDPCVVRLEHWTATAGLPTNSERPTTDGPDGAMATRYRSAVGRWSKSGI